ncbi:MAG: MutS family DNA mismatch repair protein [Ktedonobacteraceae bacterium]
MVITKKQERIALLEGQIRRAQRHIDALTPRSNRFSWARVVVFFGGVVLSIILLVLLAWWVALPVFLLAMLAFGILAHFHGHIDRSIARHTRWIYIKSAHIARMKLDWEHIPSVYATGPQAGHPFEFDLDITGQRSLHQLLNTAISREGSLRLRDWLLTTHPELATLQKRQGLVRELMPMTRFRDRLILNSIVAAGRSVDELEGKRLLNWLQRQNRSASLRPLFLFSAAFNVLTALLLILSFVVPSLPQLWYYSLLLSLLFFFATADRRGDMFDDATYLRYGFATLSLIFSYLESYPYGEHAQLKKLCAPFFHDRSSGPSALLKGTARIASLATLKKNGLLWLLVNALVPWDFYCAYRLNQYKAQLADRLPTWLDTWFELEALCSLAAFAYLNPEYVLPEITPGAAVPGERSRLFSGQGLGHPLIVVEKKVTNDFTLNALGQVVIITGSNMAGKSTFLRTLGVNLCLAYAGAPVDARDFRSDLFRLYTCIRVTDSVTDGYSYFYAEVKRLRGLLDALDVPDQPPLFFLIDEIFKGTNNRERLIGSRSFVRALVGHKCVGIISTHDLELVGLAETLLQVRNYHFREDVLDGRMVFDYVLRSGPSPTTNALKIMAMEGLPIEE